MTWRSVSVRPSSLADYDSLMLGAAPATGPGAIGAPPADLEGGDRPGTGYRASELLAGRCWLTHVDTKLTSC